jgi:hypothetical protein
MSFSNITVGELRAALEGYSDDTLVVLAEDGDGNSFSPVVDITNGNYIAEDEYNGDFVSEEDAAEDEDINLDGSSPAVVLWPAG